MKILAVTAGRKNGNGEILAKAALMRAEELGAEVKMINLHDYNIKACCGCESCTVRFTQRGEAPICVYNDKDDMATIMKEWLSADGIIAAVPAYQYMPAGIWRVFTDRHLAYEPNFHRQVGNTEFLKPKVGAIICNGGSTSNWMSLGIESIQISMISQDVKVIDHLMVKRAPRPGQVLLNDEALERAAKLGENVVKAMQDYENATFYNEDNKGWCPVCNSNLLSLGRPHWDGKKFEIECPICHSGGHIDKNEEGNWEFIVTDESVSMMEEKGATDHFFEIQDTMRKYFGNLDTINEKRKKYADYVPGSVKVEK